MPSGACVIRYEGARGVTWRVNYRDADGVRVRETVGSERDGIDRNRADAAPENRMLGVPESGTKEPETAETSASG